MLVTGAFAKLFTSDMRKNILKAYNSKPKKVRNVPMYKIELKWRRKRGCISESRRYVYTGSKRKATQLAKRIIARADHRFKAFKVTIIHTRYGAHIDQWVKANGNIIRTK